MVIPCIPAFLYSFLNFFIFYRLTNRFLAKNKRKIDYENTLIDLENDGSSEIIALDNRGDIYAFDNNLLLKNGFPIHSNANGPILAMDLLGDNSPELIIKIN